MKTAVALALCLVATAATSDDEQAQARARLLLQRAVEKVRAGVEQGVQGRAPAATAGAGGARRLAGSAHAGVISRAVYPESDTTCATTPMRWDVEMPHVFTDGECESFTLGGQTLSTRSTCASATSYSSNLYSGGSCSGTLFDTEEVTDDACAPNYDASNSYSYSYSFSFSYGDLDGYAKWGCEAIPAADVAATITYHIDSVTCDDAAPKNYQVWHAGCQPQGQTSVKYSCDATDGFRVKFYTNADCSGSPNAEVTAFQADTCNQGMKVTCGCAAGVGCSTSVVDVPTAAPTKVPTSQPSREPTTNPTLVPTPVPTSMPSAVPTPVPACCVEHQFTENGEVEGTTCYGGRSPWDAATMTDLCTAGYSEYGAAAPPFRDCRQEAIDSGNCGTYEMCVECENWWDWAEGKYWANVGYEACPDWVVDAINAEGATGGQCADWVRDGYSYPSGSCGDHAWGADRDGYSKCAWLGREPYPEGDPGLHVMGDDAEMCCPSEDWRWANGCRPDYCTSSGNDCYASMDWGEPATCSNGYFPTPPNPTTDDPEYTCCPSATSYPAGSCGDHAWGADHPWSISKCAWLGREPYPEGDAALYAMGDDAETCCPSADSCFVLVAFEPDPATQAMLGLPGGEFSVGLNDAGKSYHPDEGGNVHSNTFFTVQTTEGTKMLHRSTDGSILFPDMPDEWTTDATRPPSIDEDFLINVGLHVHCQEYASGAKALAIGNAGSAGSWVVNEDGTISPHHAPHLVLVWGDFTTASCWESATGYMDPQPNNLVLMDSAMALGCEAAREADPAQMCAPVFRARGVDCDHAGHGHGSTCDGLHPMAGWTGEACSWAHGETHGCPIANVPRHRWESDLWSCDQLCGEIGGRCNRAAYMSNNHCGSDVTEQFEISCWDHVNGMGAWVEDFDPEHALCWCWHYYHEDDDDDDDDGLGGGSELVMSGGLVAIGLTFTGITIATIANLMQEQCALGPTIIFEAGTTHPYYISPNLCTIGTHTYASKKTVRDASPRKVCRKFCEAASAAGKLALKHVQGLTCYCKRR